MIASSGAHDIREAPPPPFWLSFLICAAIVGVMAWLRLVLYPDRLVPLSYSLALLLCLWNRNLYLLYGMAVVFSGMCAAKLFMLLPHGLYEDSYSILAVTMQVVTIWVVVGVIHALLLARLRLVRKNQELAQANGELQASNEELAAREEEISMQNEELQSQTEELEQQAEELRQQSEELEQQSEELQQVNEVLARREQGLHTLLESGRWLRGSLDQQSVMNGICHAAVQLMGGEVQGAAVVTDKAGQLVLQGQSGFGVNDALAKRISFSHSFAALVLECGQTAFVEDIQLRPDVELPQPAVGRPFRSVLSSPIWLDGQPVAAVELYSQTARPWTDEEFRVIEWLAAQCALALQALTFQQELEVRRRDAEEASVHKTRFLAAVSHDVRTPANAISLLADLLHRTASDPQRGEEVAEMAADLKSNARALVDLVSDVLDLARFDAGRLDLQVSEFSLESLVAAEIKQAMPVAKAKGLHLHALPPERNIWLRTDRMKLARVLSNLIGNAVKFTECGDVQVRCDTNSDGGIRLHVIDTGVGIAADHLAHIFDEFYQLRNPERDRSKGTGLGLAICKRLVDGIGCSLTVNSVPGAGTTFTVQIPEELVVSEPRRSDAQHDGQDGAASLAGLRVLLVEDHDVTRRTVAHLLAAAGAIISQARNGREALHLLAHGPHHVMLLDLMLPDIDGSEVLRRVQAHRPRELSCILAISGDVRESRAEEVKRLGAAALIAKPINADQLMQILRHHCVAPRQAGHDHTPRTGAAAPPATRGGM